MKIKDIEGYNGRYKIDENGDVHTSAINTISYHKLKPSIDTAGYKYVCLYKNKKPKNKYIHRLLAQHFIINPDCKRCVNHIDGDKLNNKLSNLEWCTYRENVTHYYSKQKHTSKYVGVCWSKTNKKWIARITKFGNKIYLGGYDTEESAYLAYKGALV